MDLDNIILRFRSIADKKRIPEVDPKTKKKRSKDKHSDLYTDEDPKGTIHGLGFKDKKTALESIRKINNSNRKYDSRQTYLEMPVE